jgi:hypothetical protein
MGRQVKDLRCGRVAPSPQPAPEDDRAAVAQDCSSVSTAAQPQSAGAFPWPALAADLGCGERKLAFPTETSGDEHRTVRKWKGHVPGTRHGQRRSGSDLTIRREVQHAVGRNLASVDDASANDHDRTVWEGGRRVHRTTGG